MCEGVIRAKLPADNEVLVGITSRKRSLAKKLGTTCSAAAVELWRPLSVGGAVVAVGNAPTITFRLLEILEEGGTSCGYFWFTCRFRRSSRIQGSYLLSSAKNLAQFLTLKGRRGGSAMAAAAVNALTFDG